MTESESARETPEERPDDAGKASHSERERQRAGRSDPLLTLHRCDDHARANPGQHRESGESDRPPDLVLRPDPAGVPLVSPRQPGASPTPAPPSQVERAVRKILSALPADETRTAAQLAKELALNGYRVSARRVHELCAEMDDVFLKKEGEYWIPKRIGTPPPDAQSSGTEGLQAHRAGQETRAVAEQLDPVSRAIGLLVARDGRGNFPTIRGLATKVGVAHTTLSKNKQFRVVWEGLKEQHDQEQLGRVRRGEKDRETGEIVAPDADEGAAS